LQHFELNAALQSLVCRSQVLITNFKFYANKVYAAFLLSLRLS
jgi:hypothetical protein